MNVYYKAVAGYNGQLGSWWHGARSAGLVYGPGIETRPLPGWGALAVFTTLESALAFMQQYGSVIRTGQLGIGWSELVLRCTIDLAEDCRLARPDGDDTYALITDLDEMPHGTVCASCVRGIDIVRPEEVAARSVFSSIYRGDYARYQAAVLEGAGPKVGPDWTKASVEDLAIAEEEADNE
jgi:hypothetical protein